MAGWFQPVSSPDNNLIILLLSQGSSTLIEQTSRRVGYSTVRSIGKEHWLPGFVMPGATKTKGT